MKLWLWFVGSLILILGLVALVPACPPAYKANVVVKEVVAVKKVVAEVIPVAVFAPIALAVPTFTVGYNPPPAPAPAVGVAPVAPVPVATPAPVAVPPPPPPPVAVPGAGLTEVLVELRKINQRIDVLERRQGVGVPPPPPEPVAPPQGGANPPPQPQGPNPNPTPANPTPPPANQAKTALGVYTAKCAQCHQQGRERDGGGFVLLNQAGQVVPLGARETNKIMTLSYQGKMPPKSNKLNIPPLTDDEVALIMNDVASRAIKQ